MGETARLAADALTLKGKRALSAWPRVLKDVAVLCAFVSLASSKP